MADSTGYAPYLEADAGVAAFGGYPAAEPVAEAFLPEVGEVWGDDHVAEAELPLEAEDHVLGLLRWFREGNFALEVAEWSWDRCMDFPRGHASTAMESVEHPLACTRAHLEYRALFEVRAQEYLRAHGLEETHILELAEMYLARLRCGDAGACDAIEGLLASEEYSSFFAYMCSVRCRREWAEKYLCSSSDELHWTELVRRSLRSDLGDVTVGDDSEVESLE